VSHAGVPAASASDAAAQASHEPQDKLPDASPKQADPPAVTASRPGDPRVSRKAGESNQAWKTRAAALQTRYGYSKAALDRNDFAAAAGGFEAILLEEPGFLDAPQLLVQAQSGMRASANALFKAGKKLDAAGDWMGALQKYDQARQTYSGIPGIAESLQRVREKLTEAGTAAFNQGRQHEANGRPQDAIKEYEKAIQWLAADDPNRHAAQARVDKLKRN
jgi:tetratricopeptide (TPR) repeat protein